MVQDYNLEKQISGQRAVLQGLQSWSNYIWSRTVDICLYRNSTTVSRSQRLGYKRAGPSGLAELEHIATALACAVEQ